MTNHEPPAERLDPGVPLPSYRIDSLIDEEGGWRIFRAWDLKRECGALVLVPGIDKRFDRPLIAGHLARAEAIMKLRHPGIVAIHDLGTIDTPFIAEEIVDGPSLKNVLDDQGWLEPRDALAIIAQIARALDFAHARKQHHGLLGINDIVIDERSGRVKLKGFVSVGDTNELHLIRSPEYLMGNDIDGRSDLFMLGAILYRLLAARFPFSGRDPKTVARLIIESEPRPLGELRPALPPGVIRIVDRLLAKDRRERFQTGNAVAEAIERMLPSLGLLRDEPPQIVPEAVTPRRPLSRPHPAGALVAVSIAAIIAGITYYAYNKDDPPNGEVRAGRTLPAPPTSAIPSIPEIVSLPRGDATGSPESVPDDRAMLPTPAPVDDQWLSVTDKINRLGCTRVESEPGWFDRQIIAYSGSSVTAGTVAEHLGGLNDTSEVRIDSTPLNSTFCSVLDVLAAKTVVADRRLLELLPANPTYDFNDGEILSLGIHAPDFSSHVVVDYIGADGMAQRLWPSDEDRILSAGDELRLGDGDEPFSLEVTPPFGDELLVLLASTKPILPLANIPTMSAGRYLAELESALDKLSHDAEVISSVIILHTHKTDGDR
ncbi:MAG: DUF4384 domain-containing protein [Geminicoccaceae bacterium]|nr:DUF4384 domain-containing protein [Geminicoccaceae bacterium]MCB9944299.1 DUF4384 domain-containing protein [Geminicoccaceae bacterium]